MRFTFLVEVEVQRVTGKFVSREEIADTLIEAIEGAEPGTMYVGDGSEYETVLFEASESQEKKQ